MGKGSSFVSFLAGFTDVVVKGIKSTSIVPNPMGFKLEKGGEVLVCCKLCGRIGLEGLVQELSESEEA